MMPEACVLGATFVITITQKGSAICGSFGASSDHAQAVPDVEWALSKYLWDE